MGKISYLEYSVRDFEYAKGNLSIGFYDPCGRFCQQSIEKRLKYYIEMHGTTDDLIILITHNLGKLYDRVCIISKTDQDLAIRGALSKLTDYYFDTNYPKDLNIELTQEMAQEAIEITETINNWIDELLGASDRP